MRWLVYSVMAGASAGKTFRQGLVGGGVTWQLELQSSVGPMAGCPGLLSHG